MTQITLVNVKSSDLADLSNWHEDNELSKRYGGSHWPDKMFNLTRKSKNRFCKIAFSGEDKIGYIDFEIDEEKEFGWIGLVVNPRLRGSGYGTRILEQFKSTKLAQAVKELRGGIEADNPASIRCFEKAGFEKLHEKPDSEDCYIYFFRVKIA